MLRGEFRHRDGELIEHSTGRRIFVRGVNVPAKLPPFKHNLSADDLERLRSFGFTAIRLIVVWEALEPNERQYDHDYMLHIRSTVRLCAKYNLSVLIDPHQDCWSRWTGGDGAPRWTLGRLGFRLQNLEACAAAVTDFHGGGHPLLWSTNYHLFATATMFTLFFASERFAPHVTVDGLSAREWLQTRFIDAFAALAAVLKDERNVIGFGTLNEPSLGWIGCRDLRRVPTPYRFGYALSPQQCIRLAHGGSVWGALFYGYPFVPTGWRRLNPERRRLMEEGVSIWPETLKPDHFALGPDEDPETVFLRPFWDAFGRRIRERGGEDLYMFTEPVPMESLAYRPKHTPHSRELHAPHYYDLVSMGMQRFLSWFAFDFSTGWPALFNATRARHNTVAMLQATVLGEVGMCWLGKATDAAFDATFQAIESNRTPAVFIWCYIPDHASNSDGWNGEDFSIWSESRLRLRSAVRPYPLRVAGRPVLMRHNESCFMLQFVGADDCFETLIYTTPRCKRVTVSDGSCSVDGLYVRYTHAPTLGDAVHSVCVWFD
jgi:hypothetical protein